MKKIISILVLSLLLGLGLSSGLNSQICLADEQNKIHGEIELIGYFERINGQEWNLNLSYELTNQIQIGILENIHQYQEWQNRENEYYTEAFLIYKFEIDNANDYLEFYFVPINTINSPYFKVNYKF